MALQNPEQVSRYIIDWLNTYIIENSALKGFIVGVSGGVDSAVVASLCARTGKEVVLLNLPIKQHDDEYVRAKEQIEVLENSYSNVKGIEITLDKTFDVFQANLPEEVQANKLVMANSRSRLRMMNLYAVGQANHLLVVGTGNKIEDYGIGFFTKYGDGGVDIQPIGDLVKSEVFQLAEYLKVIPSIRTAVPTDGLWEEKRTDEEQIGATYEELEEIMALGQMEKEQFLTERQKEVKKIYDRLHKINRHKILPIPICDLSEFRG